MSNTRAQLAIANNETKLEVAKAAVKDVVENASTNEEKEKLAVTLYKEATGRFPQDSSDRLAVYTGGFWLLGIVFAIIVAATVAIVLNNKTVPEALTILATALVSGVVGGLFGYAKQ